MWVPTQGWVGTRVACNKNMPGGKRIEIREGIVNWMRDETPYTADLA